MVVMAKVFAQFGENTLDFFSNVSTKKEECNLNHSSESGLINLRKC